MIYSVLLASYALFFMADLLNLRRRENGLLPHIVFITGALGFISCFSHLLFRGVVNDTLVISGPAIGGLIFSMGLLLLCLFPSVTHSVPERPGRGLKPLISSGMYALCRHPGVLAMALCCIFLYLLCPTGAMGALCILDILLDLIYVKWQDVYIFPFTISDYEGYKKTTPFLIPNSGSISRFFNSPSKR